MPRLSLTSPRVVSEIIDGEAIILDLRGGKYFATDGVGAVAWVAATHGWATEEIVSSASAYYPNQPTAGHDVSALFDGFIAANLLKVAEDADPAELSAIEWPTVYATPVLEEHDDLQDMMQLDPIHDTDASGWPMPAPKSP